MIRFDAARHALLLAAACLLPLAGISAFTASNARAADYPTRPIELLVPYQPGGGTDALARAFAEASRKHLPASMYVSNKPGASGAIGWSYVINSKPDGYTIAVMTVEIATLPHLGLAKFTHEDFIPIAQLNADPAAITVRADAPWNTYEEFIAAAKKGDLRVGNSGVGSIWHLAAAALEDRTGAKFLHVPYQGAGPAVLALMGSQIDAVSVSPAEVSTYVQAGKLKTLAVMADQRVKGFEKVPTLKERGVDLSIGTWRGLGVAKGTPQDVVDVLRAATQKTAAEPSLHEAMDKLNLGYAYADAAAFKQVVARDHETFKVLIPKLNLNKP
jgi:tripartite-type tricarboxylate transporter receptor subunit TctC